MGKLVCTGAALQCSFGAQPSTFSASGQKVSAPQAAGVITDTSAQSIPLFGTCMSMSNPQVARSWPDFRERPWLTVTARPDLGT